jgi:hypothetical protein
LEKVLYYLAKCLKKFFSALLSTINNDATTLSQTSICPKTGGPKIVEHCRLGKKDYLSGLYYFQSHKTLQLFQAHLHQTHKYLQKQTLLKMPSSLSFGNVCREIG